MSDALDMRDAFALAALIACGPSATLPRAKLDAVYIAKVCYAIADAMLKERKK